MSFLCWDPHLDKVQVGSEDKSKQKWSGGYFIFLRWGSRRPWFPLKQKGSFYSTWRCLIRATAEVKSSCSTHDGGRTLFSVSDSVCSPGGGEDQPPSADSNHRFRNSRVTNNKNSFLPSECQFPPLTGKCSDHLSVEWDRWKSTTPSSRFKSNISPHKAHQLKLVIKFYQQSWIKWEPPVGSECTRDNYYRFE